MAAALFLTLALLALQPGPKSNEENDVETEQRMKQRELYLSQEMTRLLEEVEQRKGPEEMTLLSGLGQWQLWAIPAALLLVGVVYWLYWAMVAPSPCCSHQQSSSNKADLDKGKEEEDLKALPYGVRSLTMSTSSAAQGLPTKCKLVKDLVDGLLSVCRVLSALNFMPQLYQATGTEETCEAWTLGEKSIAYHLLVFLRAPPGHTFRLNPDTTEQLAGRASNIHVMLECVCWKEELLGGCVCLLHHQDTSVTRAQTSFVLENLCTSSYLDLEKVARWVQLLVTSAWHTLPESHNCKLTVLPSSKSCKFQLTTNAEVNIMTEIFFAVDHTI